MKRYQPVITRQSDENDSHWRNEFEKKLITNAVQPRDSIYNEIIHIMNNSKSKHSSVQAAVDDMMQRSGLTNYLQNKQAELQPQKEMAIEAKAAQLRSKMAQNLSNFPKLLQEVPRVKRTLENIINDTKGNLPISAILHRLHSLHSRDIADENVWEDENLIRYISQMNLQAKSNNPGTFENFDTLGKFDHSSLDSETDKANSDAFSILMPVKI